MRVARLAAVALFALWARQAAAADEAPGDCLGVDFDPHHPVAIGKVAVVKPRALFRQERIGCCRLSGGYRRVSGEAYLIPGNLALLGKTNNAYSCVSYKSADAKKPRWTNGWLASASLAPVMAAPAPARADWIGAWVHASGHITIGSGASGAVTIQGKPFMTPHRMSIPALSMPAPSRRRDCSNLPMTAASRSMIRKPAVSCACNGSRRSWSSKTTMSAAA